MRLRIDKKYQELLPPLSTEEREALEADLKANGQMVAVICDEDGVVLDGMHRFDILGTKCEYQVIEGLSEAEKKAFTYRANFVRRNLSPNQKEAANKCRKDVYFSLREQGYTQKSAASCIGTVLSTVQNWDALRNIQKDKTQQSEKPKKKPDVRVKLPAELDEEIVERSDSGETMDQIAADYGVDKSTISRKVKATKKKQAEATERKKKAEKAKKAGIGNGIIVGDYREIGSRIPDSSVQLIFTDPPYDDETLPQYSDLGTFAARVLVEGGSLVTYFPQARLPFVCQMLGKSLNYYWIIACNHAGPSARFKSKSINVGWKPLLWYTKGASRFSKRYFSDRIDSSYEKGDHEKEWQQSVVDAEHCIEQLTEQGSVVVDPYAGSGTTLIAAKLLNRVGHGFEVDEEQAAIASERISNAISA